MNKEKGSNKIQESKLAPPPKNLPIYGRDKPEFVSYVAWSNYEAALEQKKFLFGVRRHDLRRNTLVLGRPGMGKTKFLQAMVRQDIAHGFGCCVLDFRGELFKNILEDIPEDRLEDLIVFDTNNEKLRLHINPLDGVSPDFVYPLIRIIEDSLESMYPKLWNPQLEYLTHNLFASVLNVEKPTLHLAYDLLTDKNVRQDFIETTEKESLKKFWREEYSRWENEHEGDALLPLVNILRSLSRHPAIEDIYQAEGGLVSISNLMKEKKIVLIRLRPDRIGDTAATFFGTLILARYLEMTQNKKTTDTNLIRKDYTIYLDEFPQLQNTLFQNFLSVGGSVGTPFVVSLNSTLSVSSDVVQQLLTKTDNLFCFRLFGEDATRIKGEVLPVFDSRDLQNLGVREMYCRIVINNELSQPFSATTLEVLPLPNSLNKSEAIDYVSERYGLPEKGLY